MNKQNIQIESQSERERGELNKLQKESLFFSFSKIYLEIFSNILLTSSK